MKQHILYIRSTVYMNRCQLHKWRRSICLILSHIENLSARVPHFSKFTWGKSVIYFSWTESFNFLFEICNILPEETGEWTKKLLGHRSNGRFLKIQKRIFSIEKTGVGGRLLQKERRRRPLSGGSSVVILPFRPG